MKFNKLSKKWYALALSSMLTMVSATASAAPIPAADFTLKSMSGENVRLEELRGQIVLINFWASWCGPCRQEMPYLDDLQQKYQDLGFTVLGVNVDENSDLAKNFLADVPVSFPILFDHTNSISELYQVDAMPTSVFVDRDGNVQYLHRGYKAGVEEKYKKLVKALIRG